MKKDYKIFYILILLTSISVQAQFDPSVLSMLDEGIGSSSIDRDTKDVESREPEDISTRSIIQDDFTDSNYGYTGGASFNNPPLKKLSEKPLEYFGYDYFTNSSSPFLPLINIPIPSDYMIGPNDVIKIILYGNKNKKYELEVNRDGNIFIPELGPLTVAGISINDLKALVEKTITTQLIGTEVSVTLGSLRTIDIYILGAANNPGMLSLSALSRMTDAVFKSGGINPTGSLRKIKLKRNGTTISELDLYDFLIDGDAVNNQRLMQGDVILIESIGKTAGIRGEVNRPAIYELKEDEKLSDLLRFAGNLKPKANKSNSELLRIDQSTSSFDLVKVDLGKEEDLRSPIENGDIISIFPINNKIQNAVLVQGHTIQPGFYPWHENMTITDLFNSSDELLEMTDLNYVLLKRKNKSTQNYTFLQIDLEKALISRNPNHDLQLFDQDEILFLPSLLSANQIKTKLIRDNYSENIDQDKSMLENEWTSLTYLRKSLLDQEIKMENQEMMTQEDENLLEGSDNRRYYEYSIYDYCTIPEDMAVMIVEEPINIDLTWTITNFCREQLIEPIIDIVKRDNVVDKMSRVSIFGSVHFPGSYPYTEGMSLADAIKAAGGPKNGTYESQVEITSLNNDGKKFSSSSSFSTIDDAERLKLQKLDTISLKQISTEIKTVEIRGEVFFPGVYPITENQTLSELVMRAGGFTEYASPDAAFFQRKSLKEAETKRLRSSQSDLKRKILLSSQSSGLGEEGLSKEEMNQLNSLINEDIDEFNPLGRLVINFEEILAGKAADLVLEDGDSVNIPKSRQSISVIGEVFISNSHIFKENLSVDDYINLSGGVTSFADESSTYIIKADGSIISPSQLSSGFFRSTSLNPGDTIVVPLQVQPFSSLRAATEITQIIYQMALAAAAVNSF